jgi:ABC-type multidrug transport system permease subunit
MDQKPPPIEAVIVDFEMPFTSMIVFLIKLALAAIPAMFIVAFVYGLILVIIGRMGHT